MDKVPRLQYDRNAFRYQTGKKEKKTQGPRHVESRSVDTSPYICELANLRQLEALTTQLDASRIPRQGQDIVHVG